MPVIHGYYGTYFPSVLGPAGKQSAPGEPCSDSRAEPSPPFPAIAFLWLHWLQRLPQGHFLHFPHFWTRWLRPPTLHCRPFSKSQAIFISSQENTFSSYTQLFGAKQHAEPCHCFQTSAAIILLLWKLETVIVSGNLPPTFRECSSTELHTCTHRKYPRTKHRSHPTTASAMNNHSENDHSFPNTRRTGR